MHWSVSVTVSLRLSRPLLLRLGIAFYLCIHLQSVIEFMKSPFYIIMQSVIVCFVELSVHETYSHFNILSCISIQGPHTLPLGAATLSSPYSAVEKIVVSMMYWCICQMNVSFMVLPRVMVLGKPKILTWPHSSLCCCFALSQLNVIKVTADLWPFHRMPQKMVSLFHLFFVAFLFLCPASILIFPLVDIIFPAFLHAFPSFKIQFCSNHYFASDLLSKLQCFIILFVWFSYF
jgi:hypothetical protein